MEQIANRDVVNSLPSGNKINQDGRKFSAAPRLSDDEITRAKGRWDVVAADVALKRTGREMSGLCPFHQERTPSFFVVPDKGFFVCFGCGATGDTITYTMRVCGCSFPDAVHRINGTAARQPPKAAPVPNRLPVTPPRPDKRTDVETLLRVCGAVLPTTAAYLYLHLRGLISPVHRGPTEAALGALRAHPGLYCHETGQTLPALVAPIVSSDGVTAVQRIWVLPRVEYVNGDGPKDNRAPLATRKKTLGDMLDGAVRLGAPRNRLGLAEGVETAIAAAMLHRGMPVWATCGSSRLGSVAIPEGVETIRIYGDNGDAGLTLAHKAAQAYHREGFRVEIRFPEARFDDFNSQLLAMEAVQ